MKICPKCGKENSNNSERCEGCGEILINRKKQAPEKKNPIVPAIGVIAVLLIVGGGMFYLGRSSGSNSGPEETPVETSVEATETEQSTKEKAQAETEATTHAAVEDNKDVQEDNAWGDEVLEAKMREITGNNSDDFSPEDAIDLTKLDLSNEYDAPNSAKIKNISALGKLTNLEELNLAHNQVTDISALASLKKLKKLDIWSNSVEDISALSELNELKVLNISDTQITDVSVLSGLSNLNELYMFEYKGTDLNGLEKLSNVEHFCLSKSPVSDIGALSGMTKLKYLSFRFKEKTSF